MVILGLGPRQIFTLAMKYIILPPLTIVSPRPDDEQQDCLNGKTDAICEENNGVNCRLVNGELWRQW